MCQVPPRPAMPQTRRASQEVGQDHADVPAYDATHRQKRRVLGVPMGKTSASALKEKGKTIGGFLKDKLSTIKHNRKGKSLDREMSRKPPDLETYVDMRRASAEARWGEEDDTEDDEEPPIEPVYEPGVEGLPPTAPLLETEETCMAVPFSVEPEPLGTEGQVDYGSLEELHTFINHLEEMRNQYELGMLSMKHVHEGVILEHMQHVC